MILKVGTFLLYYPKRNIWVDENCPTNFSMSNVSDVYFGGLLFETRFGKRRAQLFRGFIQFLEAHCKVYLKLNHYYLFLWTSHFITGLRHVMTFRSTTDRIYDGCTIRLWYNIIILYYVPLSFSYLCIQYSNALYRYVA